jgi:hypothetical protein
VYRSTQLLFVSKKPHNVEYSLVQQPVTTRDHRHAEQMNLMPLLTETPSCWSALIGSLVNYVGLMKARLPCHQAAIAQAANAGRKLRAWRVQMQLNVSCLPAVNSSV